MKNSAARDAFIAVIVTVAVLAPFLNKAFHIDDPLFLWMGQQIAAHPGDPYAFAVNWYGNSQPMSSVMQNPPLSSYYMAFVASFLGWSEPVMHGAFLFPALAAVVGTFFLARRLSGSPLLAALLLLFMPVFLVSATGVMCDVWLLALWVWSIECWLGGLERSSFWLLLLSAILTAAATLTKYFGTCLIPLLAAYTLMRERRATFRLLFLVIPLGIIATYEIVTKAKYGHGLFSNAMIYSSKVGAARQWLSQLITGLSFTGGCLISILFYAPLLKLSSREAGSRAAEVRAGLASGQRPDFRSIIIGAVIFAMFVPLMYFSIARGLGWRNAIAVTLEGSLFVTTGIAILALAVADLVQRKTADSLLLFLWVIGTFVFAAMMNWSITARTFLPMTPAAVILLIRRLSVPCVVAAAVTGGRSSPALPLRTAAATGTAAATWWPLPPAAVVSLLIAFGDYKLANTARSAARDFHNRFEAQIAEFTVVWFDGHWGFQYYMEEWKAKPFDRSQLKIIPGDLLIVPVNNTNVSKPPVPTAAPEQINYSQFFFGTMSPEKRAGFYSSVWGPLPWVFARIPPERYLIFRAD